MVPYSGKISQVVHFYHFIGLIFVDTCTHTHYILCNQENFMSRLGNHLPKLKIGPLVNFLLYGVLLNTILAAIVCTVVSRVSTHGHLNITHDFGQREVLTQDINSIIFVWKLQQ